MPAHSYNILTAKDGTTITVDETQRMKRSKTERVQQVGATRYHVADLCNYKKGGTET